MIVQYLREVSHRLCRDCGLSGQVPLEILRSGANFRVIREEPHDVRVFIEPPVPRVSWQQHFLLLAEMDLPCAVPEAHKFLGLARDHRCAFLRGRFRRALHFQGLNQSEMVVLAKWMKTRMAFHEFAQRASPADFFVKPME
jgi:hypothetical protein